jgi:hypothetical protein
VSSFAFVWSYGNEYDRYGHDAEFEHKPWLPRSGPHSMHAVRLPASGDAARNLSRSRGESAAQMQSRDLGPSLRLQVSSVPTLFDDA